MIQDGSVKGHTFVEFDGLSAHLLREHVRAMDNRNEVLVLLGPLGCMVRADRFNQMVGEIPAFGKPPSHFGMGDAEDALFGLKSGQVRFVDDLHDPFVFVLEVPVQYRNTHVVEEAADKYFARDAVAKVTGQPPGQNTAGNGVVPERLCIEELPRRTSAAASSPERY